MSGPTPREPDCEFSGVPETRQRWSCGDILTLIHLQPADFDVLLARSASPDVARSAHQDQSPIQSWQDESTIQQTEDGAAADYSSQYINQWCT